MRPDPDKLLGQIEASTERQRRGLLKIYLGMAAGVGKTFAMLEDGCAESKRGVVVLAGYIEPHGREETERLMLNLPSLPPKEFPHRDVLLKEFDLDGALAAHPQIILVDELAHTNPPGSRHPKRWQDIEELLEAGISVYTTVNVQHIESLNDVIAKITGILVRETVPDSFIARADKIELVDLPPEDLIQRLKEGKVYAPDKVEVALNNFFKVGNLIALRELVLRHTAQRVDAQMRSFRDQNDVSKIWPTTSRVMVCVAPNALSTNVVRAAARVASNLHAELIAISVETPKYLYLSAKDREQAAQALRLADSLGAETIVRSGQDIVTEILQIARERNVSLMVVGKPVRARWREIIFGSVVDELIRSSGELDLYIITGSTVQGTHVPAVTPGRPVSPTGVLAALGITALSTGICSLMVPYFDLSNLIMVYLVGVAFVASRFGRWESIIASVSAVLAFDFFCVPPRFTFAVTDAQYLITFFTMLIIALLISDLTIRVKLQARIASDREQRTAGLFQFSRLLLGAQTAKEIAEITSQQLSVMIKLENSLFRKERGSALKPLVATESGFESQGNELAVAEWAYTHEVPAGANTDNLPGSKGMYLPLQVEARCIGVLGILVGEERIDRSRIEIIENICNQIALSLERVDLEAQARERQVEIKSERLRNSLLSAVSHDFRTPLASITGASSTLKNTKGLSDAQRAELIDSIQDEAERLSGIVRNVLDMTRFEGDSLRLRREWHSLEELVGSALNRCEALLAKHHLKISLPQDTPLVEIDGVIFEQALINIFENIAKHTPPGTEVEIHASFDSEHVRLAISDNGPGVPEGDEERIFEKLYQTGSPGRGGFGLGLAICRAVLSAHDGSISASRRIPSGLTFTLELPRNSMSPKVIEQEPESGGTN